MKGALLPGTDADPPRAPFDANTFYLEHLAELGTFFKRTARRLGIDAGEDTLQDVWIKLRANHERIDTSNPRVVVAWCKKTDQPSARSASERLSLLRGAALEHRDHRRRARAWRGQQPRAAMGRPGRPAAQPRQYAREARRGLPSRR